MTLLLVQNLGNAWGGSAAPPAGPTNGKTVASPGSAGSLKARG